MYPVNVGDEVKVRYRDGGGCTAVCTAVLTREPGMVLLGVGNSIGLGHYKRRIFLEVDGTPWVHEYAEDEQTFSYYGQDAH